MTWRKKLLDVGVVPLTPIQVALGWHRLLGTIDRVTPHPTTGDRSSSGLRRLLTDLAYPGDQRPLTVSPGLDTPPSRHAAAKPNTRDQPVQL